jgi:hypothetical protein
MAKAIMRAIKAGQESRGRGLMRLFMLEVIPFSVYKSGSYPHTGGGLPVQCVEKGAQLVAFGPQWNKAL